MRKLSLSMISIRKKLKTATCDERREKNGVWGAETREMKPKTDEGKMKTVSSEMKKENVAEGEKEKIKEAVTKKGEEGEREIIEQNIVDRIHAGSGAAEL